MTTPFSIELSLDEHVAAVEEPRLPDGKWHPSSIYGCARKAVYEFRGREPSNPPDARSKRVFRLGHILHGFVQDAVDRQVGRSVRRAYREVPIDVPELSVTGHSDGLVQYQGGVWELQEFKSISAKGMKFGGLPKADHVGQVTPYMRGLRDYGSPALGIPPLGDALTRARISYVNKDDMTIDEHPVFWSEAKNDELTLRIGDLERHREGTTLPERLPVSKGKKDWRCGYCAFATRCWEVDSDDHEGPAEGELVGGLAA